MTFQEMLIDVRSHSKSSQDLAQHLGVSAQFLGDLLKGRRRPSPMMVDRICAYLARWPVGRKEWHVAAARAHGWDV